MVDLAVLPGFLVAAVLITLAPGPDNAYITAVALDRGVRAGVLCAAGMALGMAVHVLATAFGLALLLRSNPAAMDVLRLGGALYLAWLAVNTLRSARRSGPRSHAKVRGGRIVRRAVLTNLTNPKVILFFSAFLPQFVRPGHGSTISQLLILGLLLLLVGLVFDVLVGVVAGRVGDVWGAGSRASTALSVVAALTFATLAVLLVVDVAIT